MTAFASLVFLAMLVAATGAGVRVLAVARRTRRDPELWIGLAILLSTFGGGIETAAARVAEGDPASSAVAWRLVTARTLHVISASTLAIGIWRIFRPGRAWAALLAFTNAMLLAGIFGAWLNSDELADPARFSTLYLLIQSARVVPFVWGALESLLYYGKLRRRLRLGLADPLITHQFLLWGIASTSMATMLLLVIGTQGLGFSPLVWPPAVLMMTVCGAVGAATIYSAFFPPAFYRRWLAADAA